MSTEVAEISQSNASSDRRRVVSKTGARLTARINQSRLRRSAVLYSYSCSIHTRQPVHGGSKTHALGCTDEKGCYWMHRLLLLLLLLLGVSWRVFAVNNVVASSSRRPRPVQVYLAWQRPGARSVLFITRAVVAATGRHGEHLG